MARNYVQHGDLHIRGDFVQLLKEAGLDSFDALMSTPGEASLKKKGLADWRERLVLRMDGRLFFLKRYTNPPVRGRLRRWLFGFGEDSPIEGHWIARLEQLRIAVPVLVAFGMRRHEVRGDRQLQSLLLTAAVPGVSLEKWVPAQVDGKLRDRAFKLRLIAGVADVVKRLHEAGLFHRDLYLAHVFIDDTDDRNIALSLIDLQRVIEPRLFIERWRVKDLASLNYSTPAEAATRADRVRWFKQYRGIRKLMHADRRLIRAVARKTARIARHSRKRGLG